MFRIFLFFGIVGLSAPTWADGPESGYFLPTGQAHASCGEFLQAADAERVARGSDENPQGIYTMGYLDFMAFADGFLAGMSWADPLNRSGGLHIDRAAEMAWLENYCRAHPRKPYAGALIVLRSFIHSRWYAA
jgi:hypothetical protein